MFAEPIERLSDLSRERFLDDYVVAGKPVVVTHEPTLLRLAAWDLDYLVDRHPGQIVSVEHCPTDDDLKGGWRRVAMDLASYVALLRSEPGQRSRYYLAERPLGETFPRVAGELEVPAIVRGCRIRKTVIFAGIDTFTTAHYHTAPAEALLTQISGKKKLSLYSARQFYRLKPYPWYSSRYNFSRIPVCAHRRTSLPVDATEFTCTLGPGEMLFIPQGWFHVTRGIGESISCTHFFSGSLRTARPMIAVRDLAAKIQKDFLLWPLARLARRLRARLSAPPPAQP